MRNTAWLIEHGDGRYLALDDESPGFVWTRDVHAAFSYPSEQAARESWLIISDSDELLEHEARGRGVRFAEHEWVTEPAKTGGGG